MSLYILVDIFLLITCISCRSANYDPTTKSGKAWMLTNYISDICIWSLVITTFCKIFLHYFGGLVLNDHQYLLVFMAIFLFSASQDSPFKTSRVLRFNKLREKT